MFNKENRVSPVLKEITFQGKNTQTISIINNKLYTIFESYRYPGGQVRHSPTCWLREL